MSLFFKFRDFFTSPIKILERINIQPGWNVLDYGCDSGSYSIPAAQLVGPTGKVYAADIHTAAVREVQKKATMKELGNVYTILTGRKPEMPDASIDIVLLFYILHEFKDPDLVLRELNRVLKPRGLLATIDHKFDKDKVVSTLSHATRALRLRETGLENGKRKKTVLIFSKEP